MLQYKTTTFITWFSLCCLVLSIMFFHALGTATEKTETVVLKTVKVPIDELVSLLNEKNIQFSNTKLKVADLFKNNFDADNEIVVGLSKKNPEELIFSLPSDMNAEMFIQQKKGAIKSAPDAFIIHKEIGTTQSVIYDRCEKINSEMKSMRFSDFASLLRDYRFEISKLPISELSTNIFLYFDEKKTVSEIISESIQETEKSSITTVDDVQGKFLEIFSGKFFDKKVTPSNEEKLSTILFELNRYYIDFSPLNKSIISLTSSSTTVSLITPKQTYSVNLENSDLCTFVTSKGFVHVPDFEHLPGSLKNYIKFMIDMKPNETHIKIFPALCNIENRTNFLKHAIPKTFVQTHIKKSELDLKINLIRNSLEFTAIDTLSKVKGNANYVNGIVTFTKIPSFSSVLELACIKQYLDWFVKDYSFVGIEDHEKAIDEFFTQFASEHSFDKYKTDLEKEITSEDSAKKLDTENTVIIETSFKERGSVRKLVYIGTGVSIGVVVVIIVVYVVRLNRPVKNVPKGPFTRHMPSQIFAGG